VRLIDFILLQERDAVGTLRERLHRVVMVARRRLAKFKNGGRTPPAPRGLRLA